MQTNVPDLPADAGQSYNPSRSAFRGISWIPELDAVSSATERETALDSSEPTPNPLDAGHMSPSHHPALRQFRLDRIIGSGGFGDVWVGLQRSLSRRIAVKRMRSDIVKHAQTDDRMLRALDIALMQEALMAASLDHPNILPIHEIGRDDNGLPLIAMKLVGGKVWEHLLWEERARIGTPEFLERHLAILASVCQATAFAHSRGIMHRDIKPSQVMVGDFGEVLLMDWGLAMVFDESLAGERLADLLETGLASTRSTTLNPAGTPSYMAPEQTDESPARLGPWTDVYLLGATLYTILAGEPPHGLGESTRAFMSAKLGEVRSPSERNPRVHVPQDLEALAMRALEIDPAKRPESVSDFLAILTGAGNRRESELLAEQASVLFDHAHEEYDQLADCNALLRRAEDLWPTNPRVKALRDRVLFRFARLALSNRDTKLARLLARNISSDQARTTLDHEATALEERMDRSGRQRKVLTISTVVLLVIVSIMAGTAGKRAVELVEAQGQLAESLDGAESFMNRTLIELNSSLGGVGRADLLETTAERARDYYSQLPDSDGSAGALHQRVLAFRTIGDIFRKADRPIDALEMYERSRTYARPLAMMRPRNPAWTREYAESLEVAADIMERQGRYAEALVNLWAASAQYRSLVQVGDGDADPSGALARNLVVQGRMLSREGDDAAAVKAWEEAVEILMPRWTNADDSTPHMHDVGPAAVALLRLERIDEARPLAKFLLDRRWADSEFLQLCVSRGVPLE